MWDLYVDYSSSVVEHICTMRGAYMLGAYTNNVKCMHISVLGHIVECIGFI